MHKTFIFNIHRSRFHVASALHQRPSEHIFQVVKVFPGRVKNQTESADKKKEHISVDRKNCAHGMTPRGAAAGPQASNMQVPFDF